MLLYKKANKSWYTSEEQKQLRKGKRRVSFRMRYCSFDKHRLNIEEIMGSNPESSNYGIMSKSM